MFHSHDSTMSSSSFHGHRSSLFSGMIAVVLLGMIVYFGLLLPIQSPSSFSDPTSHCVSDVYMPEDYSRNVVHFASIALGIKAQFVARQLLISYLYNSDHNGKF